MGPGLPADEEDAYLASTDATGDDDDPAGSPRFDDEDAVTLNGSSFQDAHIDPGETSVLNISVYNEAGSSGYLNAWADWNRDGDFGDAGEWLISNQSVSNAGSNTITYDLDVPASSSVGITFFRFAYSEQPVSNASLSGGGKGEVEDYQVFNGIYRISGHVFEDITGDALSDGDTTIDDASGDQVARDGVAVYLFDEDGNQLAVATTGGDGSYSFTVPQGRYYVVVDSKTVTPFFGYNDPANDLDNVWAEQTYAPAGAPCSNPDGLLGSGDPYIRSDAGPCYGGKNGDVSDLTLDPTQAEHVAKVTVTDQDVTGLDFGFSFNVVTNTNDQDDDTNNDRTAQGSLRQFVQNANAIQTQGADVTTQGANYMRFVPAVSTNASNAGNEWWQIKLGDLDGDGAADALPAVTDSFTTIDGTAYSYADGTTVRDTNTAEISAPAPVGVSQTVLPTYHGPELEISLENDANEFRGIDIDADSVAVRRLAIYNAGGGAAVFVNEGSEAGLVEKNFLGIRADASQPGFGDLIRRAVDTDINGGMTVDVKNNYIAYTRRTSLNFFGNGLIENNLIEYSGREAGCSDGITLHGSTHALIKNNYIHGSAAYAIDAFEADENYTIENNTITATGQGDRFGRTCRNNGNLNEDELGGISADGSGALISKNVIHDTPGHGVIVSGDKITLTQNSFYNNAGISIDIYKKSAGASYGDGVTPNDGSEDTYWGNDKQDYPIFTGAVLVDDVTLSLQGYIGTPSSTTYDGQQMTIEVYKADDDAPTNDGEVIAGDGKNEPHGEGHWYLGTCTATLDTHGVFTCAVTLSAGGSVSVGDSITATATDADGNTSEFGANAEVEELEPFECSPGFYQVLSNELKILDPVTGEYTLVGSGGSVDEYNAIGWDPRTNFIYGVGPFPWTLWYGHLLIVGADGVAYDLGAPTDVNDGTRTLADLGSEYFIAADMDGNGNFYVRYGLTGEDLIRIDVDSRTFEIIDFQGAGAKVGDVTYIANALWGAYGSYLYKWDLSTRQVSKVEVAGLPDGVVYGAAYTDLAGNLYVSNNDGGVYRIDRFATDSPVAVKLVDSVETSRNDGASCPLALAPGFGIPLSGSLYHDLEPNSTRDPSDPAISESDLDPASPPDLYVKLFEDDDGDCSNGFGTTARQVVEIEDDGTYYFPAVSAGNYCLVLGDNADPDDATPYDPTADGWLYINPPDGILPVTVTDDQLAGGQESTGNDFGFFHGSRITGTVFDDTGYDTDPATSDDGTPNDALQNGDEPGIPDVTVTLSDDQGHTRTTQTDASGHYTLYLPADWGTVTLSHDLRPASGYNHPTDPTDPDSATTVHQATDYEDATAPTPDSSAARVQLSLPNNNSTTAADLAGLTLDGYNFGVVYPSSFRPDQSGTTTTPGTVTYNHTYKPGTQGTVTLSRTGGDYTYQIRVDANCDGAFDPDAYTDPSSPDYSNAAIESWNTVTAPDAPDPSTPTFLVTDAWPRNPDGSFTACAVEVRVLVPDGEPEGAVDLATLTAALDWENNQTNATPNVTDPASLTDTTTVRILGGLTLEKLGCNVTATAATPDTSDDCDPASFPTAYTTNVSGRPGDVLEYCIAYTNAGSATITDVALTDPVPFFADPEPDAYGPDQDIYWRAASGTVTYLTAASDADNGELTSGLLTVQLEASLDPGLGGLVCYRVRIQ